MYFNFSLSTATGKSVSLVSVTIAERYRGSLGDEPTARDPDVNRALVINHWTPLPSLGPITPGNSCFLKFCSVWSREGEQTRPTANCYTLRTWHREFIATVCRRENICWKVMKRLQWEVDTQARENRNKSESSEQTFHRLLPVSWWCLLYWIFSRLIPNNMFTSGTILLFQILEV